MIAGKIVVDNIDPSEEDRPPAPPEGQVRISILTAGGIHFGQGPLNSFAEDELGGPVISSAELLMESLIEKADKKT